MMRVLSMTFFRLLKRPTYSWLNELKSSHSVHLSFHSHEYGPDNIAPPDYKHVVKLARQYPNGIPSMSKLLRSKQSLDFKKLLSSWPIDRLDVHGYAPLHYAANEGREDLVNLVSFSDSAQKHLITTWVILFFEYFMNIPCSRREL